MRTNFYLGILMLFLAPLGILAQTNAWLAEAEAEPVDSTTDMNERLGEIEYEIAQLKRDAAERQWDSTHRAGSAMYQAICQKKSELYLQDLKALDQASITWLKNTKISNPPKLSVAYYYEVAADSTAITIGFVHLNENSSLTNTGYTWNDDTLCLPYNFDFKKYKNLQKAIERGLVKEIYYVSLDGIPDASSVEPIAYSDYNSAKQAEYLLTQIEEILRLAQKDPQLKSLKFPTLTEYTAWEKKMAWRNLDQTVAGRKKVLLKLNSQL